MPVQRFRYRKQIANKTEFKYRFKDDEDRTVEKLPSEMTAQELAVEIERQTAKAKRYHSRFKFCQEMQELLENELEERRSIAAKAIQIS